MLILNTILKPLLWKIYIIKYWFSVLPPIEFGNLFYYLYMFKKKNKENANTFTSPTFYLDPTSRSPSLKVRERVVINCICSENWIKIYVSFRLEFCSWTYIHLHRHIDKHTYNLPWKYSESKWCFEVIFDYKNTVYNSSTIS